MPALFQVGLISGLMDGISEGDISFKTLTQHGDTGIGTLNAGEGQVTALDGYFYAVNKKGDVMLADPCAMSPFTMVTKFISAFSFSLDNISGMDGLSRVLDVHLPTLNIFYMLRIDAECDVITLCGDSCIHSTEPMVATRMKRPHAFELTNTRGSLIATRCPIYGAGITLPGYHFHFIDQERNKGGHVLGIVLKRAKVWVTPLRRFSLVLFNNKNFDEASLTSGSVEALGQEGQI